MKNFSLAIFFVLSGLTSVSAFPVAQGNHLKNANPTYAILAKAESRSARHAKKQAKRQEHRAKRQAKHQARRAAKKSN